MRKIKISAVSYINTFPFIYGLENSDIFNEIEISRDIPSVCAQKLKNGLVDLGLVPVAVLPHLNSYNIISDFCIGTKQKVDSVFLFSQVKLEDIKNIILDYQSNTSNNLTKILVSEFWKINTKFTDAYQNYEKDIKNHTAGVIIGDRAIELKDKFKYKFDLSYEWYKYTNMPFVFALWVSNTKLNNAFIQAFNKALSFGLRNISPELITENFKNNNPEYLYDYLTKKIDYNFDSNKKKSLELYLSLLK